MPSNKSEHRRSSKPLMEKRRRARINQSLCELKSFILETAKKENCRRSKLEKADILELTVKHLQNLHKLKNSNAQEETKSTGKFVAGFNQCANEVTKFVTNLEGVDSSIQGRLLSHLKHCLSSLSPRTTDECVSPATISIPDTTTTASSPPPGVTPVTTVKLELSPMSPTMTTTTAPQTVNVINGFRVITTSRLPSGEVALIVPQNALTQRCDIPSSSPTTAPVSGSVLAVVPVTSASSPVGSNPASPSTWKQPEQTSPLALSHKVEEPSLDKNVLNVNNCEQIDSSVWRPW